MKARTDTSGYNQRLFSGGVRGAIHLARFKWLARKLNVYCAHPRSVVEIGCFDARSLDWFPHLPQGYLGVDANWEGGIDLARQKYVGQQEYKFQVTEGYWEIPSKHYDLALALETLEHLPDHVLENYLDRLKQVVTGHFFVSVPIERGLTWVLKRWAKAMLGIPREQYSWMECWHAALGNMDKVKRNQHKGFDDRRLVQMLAKRFRILEVSGIYPGFGWLGWNFQVGIVCAPLMSKG